MKKNFALLLFVLISSAHAGENEIRQSLQSNLPNIGSIDHIAKTPYSGLYEVVIDNQLLYTDEQGKYLFNGNVIDVKSRTDLTSQRSKKLFALDFDKLPLDIAIKKVKGDGKRKMAFFTDPNCGFCQRLEKELRQVNNVTLYMFLYPVFPGSAEIVHNVQCAKDPLKAWEDWMQHGTVPASASCNTSTDKVIALAKTLRVAGTPDLIFANGEQTPGYLPAAELEKHLNGTDGDM